MEAFYCSIVTYPPFCIQFLVINYILPTTMIRLIQLRHSRHGRRVAVAEGATLRCLKKFSSVYDLAVAALERKTSLENLIAKNLSSDVLDYDPVYSGKGGWKILPAFDHPAEPNRCLVTGTGLTHKKSADNRQAMHLSAKAEMTDSMKMYYWGVEGGRPAKGDIGVQPEWFYKGHGNILRGHNEALEVPAYGDDGGDEAEVAGVYIIDTKGKPHRIGLAQGNEFSDHIMEQKNYLYLAHSKLRFCALGPELVVDADFSDVIGTASVERKGKKIWAYEIRTGEKNMSHTLANLEHHHFKYAAHCRPGDTHIHFFGADAFSFGQGIKLQTGDVMEIGFTGFGRPLRNPLKIENTRPRFILLQQL